MPKLLLDKRKQPIQKELAILIEGQTIGLKECLQVGGGLRDYSAVVESFEAELYRMPQKEFSDLLEVIK